MCLILFGGYADVPLSKVVAGVRVGLINGKLVINPSSDQQSNSKLDLVMAGTADAILMIEGFCDFLTDEEMLTVGVQPPTSFSAARMGRCFAHWQEGNLCKKGKVARFHGNDYLLMKCILL